MRIEGNQKNHELCEITHGCAMQRQKGVQILEPQLCSNSFLQPLMFGLEPTEELVHLRLPVIKKGIEVYKAMPGRDSAV